MFMASIKTVYWVLQGRFSGISAKWRVKAR